MGKHTRPADSVVVGRLDVEDPGDSYIFLSVHRGACGRFLIWHSCPSASGVDNNRTERRIRFQAGIHCR